MARHFWQELGLQAVLDSLAKKSGMKQDLADRALALVTNRLCKPSSEHGLARWLESDFVCDRWVDIDLGHGEHKQSVTQGSSRAASILKTLGLKDLNPIPRETQCRTA